GHVAPVEKALAVQVGGAADGAVHKLRGAADEPALAAVEGVVGHQALGGRPVERRTWRRRLLPLRLGGGRLRLPRTPALLGRSQPRLQGAELLLLVARRRLDERRGVAVLDRLALLRDVVEVGEDAVELLLRNRVVLVIVALGAAQGQPEPDRR